MSEWVKVPREEGRYPEEGKTVQLAVDYGSEPQLELGEWDGKRWYIHRLGSLTLAKVLCWTPAAELPR